MKKRIVFVGGSSGFGHIQAARNLMDSIKQIDDSVEPEFINIFDCLSPSVRFILEDLWEFCSSHLGCFYHFIHRAIVKNEYLYEIINRRFIVIADRIMPGFAEKEISVFVATHPVAAAIGSALKRKLNFILCVVPTDFVLHNFHFYPEVDFYYLPQDYYVVGSTNYATDIFKKSLMTGIPVSPTFWGKKNRKELRKEYGLSQDKLTVLISFGGSGLGADKCIHILQALLKLSLPLQFIIIAGKNRLFQKRLQYLLSQKNNNHNQRVKIFGFVEHMADIMSVSDVFIGKAGGLSLSEALATGLPIAIIESLPGQEEYNTNFIVHNKLGIQINNPVELTQWLHSLLSPNALRNWKNRVKKFGRPFSGREITNHIISSIKNKEWTLESQDAWINYNTRISSRDLMVSRPVKRLAL